jgi:hypothetical protein
MSAHIRVMQRERRSTGTSVDSPNRVYRPHKQCNLLRRTRLHILSYHEHLYLAISNRNNHHFEPVAVYLCLFFTFPVRICVQLAFSWFAISGLSATYSV